MGEFEFNEVILHKFKVFAATQHPEMGETEFLHMLNANTHRSEFSHELITKLWSYVLCEQFEPVEATGYLRVPKTWFDHFKMSCFPKWLLRAFPYKTRTEELKLSCTPRVLYPKLPAIKSGGARVSFFTQEYVDSRLHVDEHGKDEHSRNNS